MTVPQGPRASYPGWGPFPRYRAAELHQELGKQCDTGRFLPISKGVQMPSQALSVTTT